jgi:hypothetical protein
MTEQVLLTDGSAVRIVQLNSPEKKDAQVFSLVATDETSAAIAASRKI